MESASILKAPFPVPPSALELITYSSFPIGATIRHSGLLKKSGLASGGGGAVRTRTETTIPGEVGLCVGIEGSEQAKLGSKPIEI